MFGTIIVYAIVVLFIVALALCAFAPMILEGDLDERDRAEEAKQGDGAARNGEPDMAAIRKVIPEEGLSA